MGKSCYQRGSEASLWEFPSLVLDGAGVRQEQPTRIGGAIHGQAVLGCTRKQTEKARRCKPFLHNPASVPISKFLPHVPPTLPSAGNGPPQAALGHGVYHSSRKSARMYHFVSLKLIHCVFLSLLLQCWRWSVGSHTHRHSRATQLHGLVCQHSLSSCYCF